MDFQQKTKQGRGKKEEGEGEGEGGEDETLLFFDELMYFFVFV